MMWLTLFRESIRFAWSAIVVNRLRTLLSLLGVMVGIFLITAVFSVVDSLEDNLMDTFSMLDEDVLFVQKWPWGMGGEYPWWDYLRRPQPSLEEMEMLAERMTLHEAIAYQVGDQMDAEAGNNRFSGAQVAGVTEAYPDVVGMDLAEGRVITELESVAGSAVALIGHKVAMGLFGRANVLGKRFKLRGKRLEVIGVFEEEGSSVISDGFDQVVMVPATFASRIIDLNSADGSIMVKASEGVSNEMLRDHIIEHFRPVRGLRPAEGDDFSVNELSALTGIIETIFVQVGYGSWFIGIFAILVGCFSIANIMFVSVRERTRFIGIQKAIGAKSTFILIQFLFEAIFLCVLGALIALGFIQLLLWGVNAMDLGLVMGMRPSRVAIAIIVAVASGLIAGIAPALKASRMPPVEAMRAS
jgi:putative ABC transport system permease protein